MQRSTEATLDWSQCRDKLGIDLDECSANTLVSLPNEHIAVGPSPRAPRNWVLSDVQLLQCHEVSNGLREVAEMVCRKLQIFQPSERAESLREAAELVCRKVQITQCCEVVDGLRDARELVCRQVQIMQSCEVVDGLRDAGEFVLLKV